ncbi:AbgT family transporter [Spiroplasma eriocheiris]|uniref:Aminobenzoyl-glutamate transporter n=1 Tax=Spiroplasma eriocheiris TaxID=315358 RepID=A0A0H3XI88_9MOLU|nr:AbgT family transporter [Spiroplasma eriocheiris]AHF57724.1 putative P-aminobenzoyl-glutamate transporter [Spiroplasma eriocheiris CCTCC M 207170]AKM54175.1 aminobenzoyl-glutamate transporter [Spiroplasma eriocheiris]
MRERTEQARSLKFRVKFSASFGKIGNKTLNGIEWLGNKLPKPFYLFIYLTLIIMVLAMILHFVFPEGITIYNIYVRENQQVEKVYQLKFFNLFSGEGIIWWLTNFITNFTGLVTIGVVLITTLCITVAEKSGFIDVSLRKMASRVPKVLLTPVCILIGCISSVASDAGYLILIPLAGVLYYKANRHPLVGIVAMFAGVSAGFAGNLIPASSEFLLTSSTNSFFNKEVMNALSNWYFTMLLIPIYTLVGWFVTDKIVEKRIINRYAHMATIDEFEINGVQQERFKLTKEERRGMWFVLGFTLIYLAITLIMMFVPYAPFNAPFNPEFSAALNAKAPGLANQYSILPHLVLVIAFLFLGIGLAYGYAAKTFKTKDDFTETLTFGLKRSASTLVIFLVMSQFIATLSKTKLDMAGAYYLGQGIQGINPTLTIFIFVVLIAFINLFMGSLSAKWFVLGPIFAIALEQAGIHPAATVMAYRVGDSATNIISPIMTYFPLVLMYGQNWIKKEHHADFKIGSLMSLMVPYSFFFFLSSTAIFLIWFALGIPVGVNGPIYIEQSAFAATIVKVGASEWVNMNPKALWQVRGLQINNHFSYNLN